MHDNAACCDADAPDEPNDASEAKESTEPRGKDLSQPAAFVLDSEDEQTTNKGVFKDSVKQHYVRLEVMFEHTVACATHSREAAFVCSLIGRAFFVQDRKPLAALPAVPGSLAAQVEEQITNMGLETQQANEEDMMKARSSFHGAHTHWESTQALAWTGMCAHMHTCLPLIAR